MDAAVQAYIDAIPAEHRPLYDRIHRLVLGLRPDAVVVMSYRMLSYQAGHRKLYVGAWKHGISLYGWQSDRAAGFVSRHPDLKTSKGTIQLRPEDAASITDEELTDLVRSALEP